MRRFAAIGAAFVATTILLIGGGAIAVVQAVFGSSSRPSDTALADIPPDFLALYQLAAGVCPALDWSVLAAIGKIETNHGRLQAQGVWSGENPWGAGGVMQFLQPTWNRVVARHQIPPGGSNPPSRYNPHDAIYAAAFYLCDSGARDGRDLHAAIFAYNHAEWYVQQVLAQAKKYSQTTLNSSATCDGFQSTVQSSGQDFSSTAMQVVRFACAQLGKPYVWGGNGDPGFDCSGLTRAAYAAAGIELPRTAQTQYNAGPRLPFGTPPRLGDLLFFGTPQRIHHVGISLGGTLMVNAPTFNKPVQVQDYQGFGDYAGLSRPAG
ncbi:NlpC/P60 family protein [Amycolatopsis sp. NPDC059657]|uniref:C40 family peptidase n=1 Tax=Amycolatopsis sp. NPDC059657 TaxID=3346899 RepID=UPI00366F9D8A